MPFNYKRKCSMQKLCYTISLQLKRNHINFPETINLPIFCTDFYIVIKINPRKNSFALYEIDLFEGILSVIKDFSDLLV